MLNLYWNYQYFNTEIGRFFYIESITLEKVARDPKLYKTAVVFNIINMLNKKCYVILDKILEQYWYTNSNLEIMHIDI